MVLSIRDGEGAMNIIKLMLLKKKSTKINIYIVIYIKQQRAHLIYEQGLSLCYRSRGKSQTRGSLEHR